MEITEKKTSQYFVNIETEHVSKSEGLRPSIASVALEKLEQTYPEGRHPANFRQFEMTLNGRTTLIGVMANPILFGTESPTDDPKEGIHPRNAIDKVKAAGYTHLISLETRCFRGIKEMWGENAFLFDLNDFRSPTVEMLENIIRIVRMVVARGQYTLFCCHSGFGRSGVAAASVKIVELIERENPRCPSPLTAHAPDIKWEDVTTTELVREAVLAVRAHDPENGTDLKARNGESAIYGPTVENAEQFSALVDLEAYLIDSLA